MRLLLVSLLGTCALLLGLTSVASAATPVIMNTSSTDGQTNWLESFAAASDGSGKAVQISLLVKHDVGRSVTGLRIDDDLNGTESAASASIRSVTAQKPNVQGGYAYSRVTYEFTPGGSAGMSCPVIGTRTRRATRQLSVRARLDNGEETATSVSNIRFVASGSNCLLADDYPFIYARSQSATSINVGQSVEFNYTGDDIDSALGSDTFEGINWRLRRLSDGATTTPQVSCPSNGDNANKTLTVTFPQRGRWVVEAEGRNDDNCGGTQGNGYWFRIGTVDVNSPASASPAGTLNATRPQKNGNTTITATVNDDDDAPTGTVEAIEWDLDENTSNGVNGFEQAEIGDWKTGLTAGQRTRTINTTGMTPGLHTVRARIGDNGALGGADNIRRTNVITTTFRVNSDPVVNNQNVATETQTALPINYGAVDADGDSLAYSITDPPDNGSLAGGNTATPTYTPNAGFAGTDSFTVQVSDGFGGTDTATISVRIDPDTILDSGPAGTLDDRGATFEFHSRADDATFECSLDGATFTACNSPKSYLNLDDGSHEFRVRALAAGNTDQSPAARTWTIDAFPDVDIEAGPDPETADTSATFEFSTSQVGATVYPKTDCKLDDGDFRPCSSPITYNDLDDGEHTFVVRATDAYGKTATDELTWTVDAIGSNTVIDSAPPAHVGVTEAEVEFSSPDGDATFECQLDGGAWEDCASPESWSGLSEGKHTFRARAIDAANIVDPTPATAVWTVDLTAPETEITAGPGLTNDPTPSFEFAATDKLDVTYECSLDLSAWEPCTSPLTTADIGDGDHTLEVRATDAVGNVDETPASRDFTIDTQAPQSAITSGPAEGDRVASSSATLGFESADSGATFRCKLDNGPWTACSAADSQSYSGLADGDHKFSVRATDEAGNVEATPPERSWIVDVTPPQTSILNGPSGTVRKTSATFDLRADDAQATFECSLDGGAYEPCTTPVAVNGLAAGDHTFAARATDEVGNVDTSPATRSWTVDTSQELPPRGEEPRKRKKCTFEEDVFRCGKPYMRARAIATPPGNGRAGFGKVKMKANGGGAPLGGVTFKLPPGLTMQALERGQAIGSLEMFGTFKGSRSVAIKSDGPGLGNASGKPRVNVSSAGRRVKVKELPAKVRRVRLVLDAPTLRVQSVTCAARTWTAKLWDWKGFSTTVKTTADVRCPKGASR